MKNSFEVKVNNLEKLLGIENEIAHNKDNNYNFKHVYLPDSSIVDTLVDIFGRKAEKRCDFVNLYLDDEQKLYACYFRNGADISGYVRFGKINEDTIETIMRNIITEY